MERPKYVNLSQIPKALQCSICANIFNIPVRLHCGHVFCKVCIDKWVQGHNTCCPFDRIKFKKLKKKIYLSDNLVEKILNDFKVYCCFRNKGCKEILLKEKMKKHKKKCDFSKISDSVIKKDQFEDESNEILIERMRKEGMDIGLLAKIKKKEKINKVPKNKDKKRISDEDDTLFEIFDDDNSENFLDKLMEIKEPEHKPEPKKKINKKPKNIKKKKNIFSMNNVEVNINLNNSENQDTNINNIHFNNNRNLNPNNSSGFFNSNININSNKNDHIVHNISINNRIPANNNPINFYNNLLANVNNSNFDNRESEDLREESVDEENKNLDNWVKNNIAELSMIPDLNEFLFKLSTSDDIIINNVLENFAPIHKRILKKSVEMYKNFFNS